MTITPPDHARPIWRFTVDNLTRGWSLTTFEGEAADLEAGPLLLDSANLEWSTESEQLPANMAPASASFVIGARSIGELHELEPTDRLRVKLTRPGIGRPLTAGRYLAWRLWESDTGTAVNYGIAGAMWMTYAGGTPAAAGTSLRATSERFKVNPGEQIHIDYDAWNSSAAIGDNLRPIVRIAYYTTTGASAGSNQVAWNRVVGEEPINLAYDFPNNLVPDDAAYARASVGFVADGELYESMSVAQITVRTTPETAEAEYYGFTGSVTDVVVDADPSRRIPAAARVTVMDIQTEASQTDYLNRPGQVWDYWPYGIAQRLENTAAATTLNITIPNSLYHRHDEPGVTPDWIGPAAAVDPRGQTARHLVADALALQTIRRGQNDWRPIVLMAADFPAFASYRTFYGDQTSPHGLIARQLVPENPTRLAAATVATTSPTDPTLTLTYTAAPAPDGPFGNPVVSARAVTVPTQWRKDRRNHITHLGIRGQSNPGDQSSNDQLFPVAAVTGSRNIRSVTGSIVIPELNQAAVGSLMDLPAHLAVAYRPWLASGTRYQMPELPIHPELIPETDLDQLAYLFQPMTADGHLVMPSLTIVGLAPEVRPYGATIGGTLTGARFALAGGRLTIYARPSTHYQPTQNFGSAAITAADARSITHDGHPITVAEAGRELTPADVRHAARP